MEELLEWLQTLMIKRAKFRRYHPRLTLDRVEISDVSEQRLHCLRKMLGYEERISKALGSIHARYKDLNDTVQTTLDKYSNILESADTVEDFEYEEATDVLRYLERETATFRKTVKSLLRTVYMSDSEAWDRFVDIEDMFHDTSVT
jgi:hypothetical protein